MGKVAVGDILVTPLKRIPLEGGDVLHAMKASDPGFAGFGEAYFSIIHVGAVKAWKRHLDMTLNLVVPQGLVKFVFIDESGDMREEVIGDDHYARLTVPPGLWFGFQGVASPASLVMNVADIQHDPVEVQRRDINQFHYQWGAEL